jgi:hypothetical protein
MRRHSGLRWLTLAGLAAWASPTEAPAAASPIRAPVVQSVLDCRKIDDGAARLACYDKAVAGVEQAEASGDLVTVDRAQRRAARHQAFGLYLPTLSFLDRGEKPEEVDRMTVTIDAASQSAYGKWTIRLDDGALWRQIDDNPVDPPPHHGSTAVIRRGVLSSYTMKIDGQQAIKVHRDR